MSGTKKTQNEREIVYRVGRKYGKIKLPKDEAGGGQLTEKSALPFALRFFRFVWKDVPFLPERMLPALFWAAPCVAFLLTMLLIAVLIRHANG
ncbi:MAG TPA: hypothetical protein VF260_10685 [Bacilli bacterium]